MKCKSFKFTSIASDELPVLLEDDSMSMTLLDARNAPSHDEMTQSMIVTPRPNIKSFVFMLKKLVCSSSRMENTVEGTV